MLTMHARRSIFCLKNSITRTLAAFVAGVLLFSASTEAWAQSNLWAERREAAQRASRSSNASPNQNSNNLMMAQLPRLQAAPGLSMPWRENISSLRPALAPSAARRWPALPAWMKSLPSAYADIQKVSPVPGARAPWVILIQDAHDVYSAQQNIAETLEHLQTHAPSDAKRPFLVGLEGAEGELDLAPYRSHIGEETHEVVCDVLLDRKILSGPEVFAMTTARQPLVRGVETTALYNDNVEAFRQALPYKDEFAAQLSSLRQALAPARQHLLDDGLRALDQSLTAHHQGQTDLLSHVATLNAIVPADGRYPNTKKLLSVLYMEKKMDFSRAETERQTLVQELSRRLSASALNDLAAAGMAFRAGQLSFADFHQHLKQLAENNGVAMARFPAFQSYLSYVLLADSIDKNALFSELSAYEESVVARAAKTDAQKEILTIGRDLDMLARLAARELSPAEWEFYATRRQAFSSLPTRVAALTGVQAAGHRLKDLTPVFEKFYQAADARNEALVSNLLREFSPNKPQIAKSDSPSVAALVAGGFHTPALQRLLAEKGVSTITLTPKMTAVPKGAAYLDVFTQGRIPLDKMFLGDRLFTAPWRSSAASANPAMPGRGLNLRNADSAIRSALNATGSALEQLGHGFTAVTARVAGQAPLRFVISRGADARERFQSLGLRALWQYSGKGFFIARVEVRNVLLNLQHLGLELFMRMEPYTRHVAPGVLLTLTVFAPFLLATMAAGKAVLFFNSTSVQGSNSLSPLDKNIAAGVITQKEHKDLIQKLLSLRQGHLFQGWDDPGTRDREKIAFLEQVYEQDQNYPGGLSTYRENARRLLEASKRGDNPFDGYKVSVPEGIQLDVESLTFAEKEKIGFENIEKMGVILVAGGLGERLGYDGIKVGIPLDLVTGDVYLQKYVKEILALQRKAERRLGRKVRIPFAIMTSDDTHDRTVALLEANGHFGMEEGQITLMKSGTVPAIQNNDGDFVLEKDEQGRDTYKLLSKPHGHGDVHMMMHKHGVAKRWLESGITHSLFIQDTNGQVFRAALAGLGVSLENDFDFNFLTVSRKAGEKAGAIAQLTKDGQTKVGNVEYNQLSAVLEGGDVADPDTGDSPYPGNTNVFIVKNEVYDRALDETSGVLGEFVNPKYADQEKTKFLSPTRLETMMQDIAFYFGGMGARVGFTNILDKFYVFSPVKNNPKDGAANAAKGNNADSMATGEASYYRGGRLMLRIAGMDVRVNPSLGSDGKPLLRMSRGVPYDDGAKVSLSPDFASTTFEVASKVHGGRISDDSTLVVEGENVVLDNLDLDGSLIIRAGPESSVTLRDVTVKTMFWPLVDLLDRELSDARIPDYLKIRGYWLQKNDRVEIVAAEPGHFEITGHIAAGRYEIRKGRLVPVIEEERPEPDASTPAQSGAFWLKEREGQSTGSGALGFLILFFAIIGSVWGVNIRHVGLVLVGILAVIIGLALMFSDSGGDSTPAQARRLFGVIGANNTLDISGSFSAQLIFNKEKVLVIFDKVRTGSNGRPTVTMRVIPKDQDALRALEKVENRWFILFHHNEADGERKIKEERFELKKQELAQADLNESQWLQVSANTDMIRTGERGNAVIAWQATVPIEQAYDPAIDLLVVQLAKSGRKAAKSRKGAVDAKALLFLPAMDFPLFNELFISALDTAGSFVSSVPSQSLFIFVTVPAVLALASQMLRLMNFLLSRAKVNQSQNQEISEQWGGRFLDLEFYLLLSALLLPLALWGAHVFGGMPAVSNLIGLFTISVIGVAVFGRSLMPAWMRPGDNPWKSVQPSQGMTLGRFILILVLIAYFLLTFVPILWPEFRLSSMAGLPQWNADSSSLFAGAALGMGSLGVPFRVRYPDRYDVVWLNLIAKEEGLDHSIQKSGGEGHDYRLAWLNQGNPMQGKVFIVADNSGFAGKDKTEWFNKVRQTLLSHEMEQVIPILDSRPNNPYWWTEQIKFEIARINANSPGISQRPAPKSGGSNWKLKNALLRLLTGFRPIAREGQGRVDSIFPIILILVVGASLGFLIGNHELLKKYWDGFWRLFLTAHSFGFISGLTGALAVASVGGLILGMGGLRLTGPEGIDWQKPDTRALDRAIEILRRNEELDHLKIYGLHNPFQGVYNVGWTYRGHEISAKAVSVDTRSLTGGDVGSLPELARVKFGGTVIVVEDMLRVSPHDLANQILSQIIEVNARAEADREKLLVIMPTNRHMNMLDAARLSLTDSLAKQDIEWLTMSPQGALVLSRRSNQDYLPRQQVRVVRSPVFVPLAHFVHWFDNAGEGLIVLLRSDFSSQQGLEETLARAILKSTSAARVSQGASIVSMAIIMGIAALGIGNVLALHLTLLPKGLLYYVSNIQGFSISMPFNLSELAGSLTLMGLGIGKLAVVGSPRSAMDSSERAALRREIWRRIVDQNVPSVAPLSAGELGRSGRDFGARLGGPSPLLALIENNAQDLNSLFEGASVPAAWRGEDLTGRWLDSFNQASDPEAQAKLAAALVLTVAKEESSGDIGFSRMIDALLVDVAALSAKDATAGVMRYGAQRDAYEAAQKGQTNAAVVKAVDTRKTFSNGLGLTDDHLVAFVDGIAGRIAREGAQTEAGAHLVALDQPAQFMEILTELAETSPQAREALNLVLGGRVKLEILTLDEMLAAGLVYVQADGQLMANVREVNALLTGMSPGLRGILPVFMAHAMSRPMQLDIDFLNGDQVLALLMDLTRGWMLFKQGDFNRLMDMRRHVERMYAASA